MKRPPVRQHIVNTASTLFYQRGYNLTGINEIIAEAGIAKATLYNHFKSKEDLCIAYLANKQTGFVKALTAHLDTKPAGEKRLLSIFDFVANLTDDKEFNGCWCINTFSEIPREDIRIREEIRNQKNFLLDLIGKEVDASFKGMRKPQRESLARKIYLLYEGAVSESHLHNATWPIKEAKSMCKLLLK